MAKDEGTTVRGVRIDDDEWREFDTATKSVGTDRSAAVRGFIRWYLSKPGAILPPRPGDQH